MLSDPSHIDMADFIIFHALLIFFHAIHLLLISSFIVVKIMSYSSSDSENEIVDITQIPLARLTSSNHQNHTANHASIESHDVAANLNQNQPKRLFDSSEGSSDSGSESENPSQPSLGKNQGQANKYHQSMPSSNLNNDDISSTSAPFNPFLDEDVTNDNNRQSQDHDLNFNPFAFPTVSLQSIPTPSVAHSVSNKYHTNNDVNIYSKPVIDSEPMYVNIPIRSKRIVAESLPDGKPIAAIRASVSNSRLGNSCKESN